MDFVVVGLGLGTLPILAGVLTLVWTAGRWERAAARATSPEDAAHDKAVATGRRDAGQALVGAGVAVLIATIGALAGSLDDQTGAFFVTTTATVAALGLLVWAYLYRTRNPLPPRRRIGTGDGGRRTGVLTQGELPSDSEPAVAAKLPTEEALFVDDEEEWPSIAEVEDEADTDEPVVAEPNEGDESEIPEAPEQLGPTMNGANDAPFVIRDDEDDHEDDWEGRRGRES